MVTTTIPGLGRLGLSICYDVRFPALFEALGFRYFGPFNGHNVIKLVEIFRHARRAGLLTGFVSNGNGTPEALAYLRENGFKTYVVSGGGVEFMRAFAEETYGIPAEQVVGCRGGVPLAVHQPG